MNVALRTFVGILLLLVGSTSNAEQLSGKVIGITDGDSITMLVDRKPVKIRLAEIDAPELGQAYGKRSKQVLSDLIFGKYVTAEVEERDKYGRSVARVYVGGTDVNKAMIKVGAAWVYRKYNRDWLLRVTESQAWLSGVGLWGIGGAVPPWKWRKPDISGCGPKRYCKQMTSCDEAHRYLKCGIRTLDRDGDGVPCESLC